MPRLFQSGSVLGSVMGVLLAVFSQVVSGQSVIAADFRVFTAVQHAEAGPDGTPGAVITRTVTIFHAGKVYDYSESSQNSEVIIYEPTQKRFRLLNLSRGIVATAAFDEIKQKVKIAREETAREAKVLAATEPNRGEMAELLTFQLSPDFDVQFDDKQQRLSLQGRPLSYNVETMRPEQPEIVDPYLEYADWICQLNYVLAIGPILPEPRMTLNRRLRDQGVLPKSVILKANTSPPINLQARHTFHLELNANERNWIYQWETRLKSDSIRQVTLQEYQKEILAAQAR